MIRALAWLTPIGFALALLAGYYGLGLSAHFSAVVVISFACASAYAVLRRSPELWPRWRQIFLAATGVAFISSGLSVIVGRQQYRIEVRQAEFFLERHIPLLLRHRAVHGAFPQTYVVSCAGAPRVLLSHCRNGVLPEAYRVVEDGFWLSFWPPHSPAYGPGEAWIQRTYSTMANAWGNSIVD